ncbi:MAG: hypothetical protein NTV34_07035 [Proteobacteria bacterium]|nr:hypothetical protein [Pseudomonadota bacterium]
MIPNFLHRTLSQILYPVVLLTCGLMSLQVLAVGKVLPTGSISRGDNVNSFRMSVQVTGLSNTTLQAGETALFNRLKFYVTSIGDQIPYVGSAESLNVPLYVEQTSEPVPVTENSLTNLTFSATITGSQSNSVQKLLAGGSSIAMTVKYFEGTTELAKGEVTISVATRVAKEAPTIYSVTPGFRQIVARFDTGTTKTFSDATTDTVTSVVMVVIEDTLNGAIRSEPLYLPAMKFSNSPTILDTEAGPKTATFTSTYEDKEASCVTVVDSADKYLNTEELDKLTLKGVFIRSVNPSTGLAKITGLQNDRSYSVFLYYEPGGLTRTNCYRAKPYINTTLSESLGEGPSKEEFPRCFIATAAYGSPLHKNLKLFTWFRDHVLLNYNPGRIFVKWYYKNGPTAAKVVAGNPTLALAVRVLLWLPALLISFWLSLIAGDPMAILVGFGALGSLTYLLFMRQRRTVG